MPTRFDSSQLQKAVRMPNGFLRVPVFATRTGVFTYRLPDGSIRRELRHPDDVFAAESLATLAGVPVTDDHPNKKNPSVMLLDADTAQEHMIGFTGDNPRRDGIFVATHMTITAKQPIAKADAGKVEVSCGYSCEEMIESGIYEGHPYDIRQTNIQYNHLAIVDRGRAGPDCKMKFDAADAVQIDNPTEGEKVEKILINGVWVEVSAAAKLAIETHMVAKADSDAAVAKVKADAAAAKTEADKQTARADGLQVDKAKLETELKSRADGGDATVIAAAVKVRRKIDAVAERVLSKEDFAKIDAEDNKAVMTRIIKADWAGVDLTGKSDDYIAAAFDRIEGQVGKADKQTTHVPGTKEKERADAHEEGSADAAYQRQREDAQSAWKVTNGEKK